MQIQVNNDFTTGGATQEQINSFLQDQQIAINILNSTFTNDISLTFDVGFGSFRGEKMAATAGGLGDVNFATAVFLPYSQLRANLLTVGQPGFFNAANLPEGDSINGMSNSSIAPSVAAAFGLAAPDRPPDGFVGINIFTPDVGGFAPGPDRIAAILHEFGHAMGRVPNNLEFPAPPAPAQATSPDPQGVIFVSALDLVRFIGPGTRLFDGNVDHDAGIFFIDGGATKVADWQSFGHQALPTFSARPVAISRQMIHSMTSVLLSPSSRPRTSSSWKLSGFRVGATAVMVLQGSDDFYQSYRIGSNAIFDSSPLGPVGTEWRFVTLGGFNDTSTTSDMLLRNSGSGEFLVYNINNNQITGSTPSARSASNGSSSASAISASASPASSPAVPT